jgi:hypothetical protein
VGKLMVVLITDILVLGVLHGLTHRVKAKYQYSSDGESSKSRFDGCVVTVCVSRDNS